MLNMLNMLDFLGELDGHSIPPENPMLNFFLGFRQISPKKCPKPGKC